MGQFFLLQLILADILTHMDTQTVVQLDNNIIILLNIASPDVSRIVMYRDGVSEGQFASVLQNELLAIRYRS